MPPGLRAQAPCASLPQNPALCHFCRRQSRKGLTAQLHCLVTGEDISAGVPGAMLWLPPDKPALSLSVHQRGRFKGRRDALAQE